MNRVIFFEGDSARCSSRLLAKLAIVGKDITCVRLYWMMVIMIEFVLLLRNRFGATKPAVRKRKKGQCQDVQPIKKGYLDMLALKSLERDNRSQF